MSSYIDNLEALLRDNIDTLEMIHESDRRFLENIDATQPDPGQYDDYLDEHDSYNDRLDDLEKEYDEIIEYLGNHPEVLSTVMADQKQRINTLIREMNGKIQAVNDIEAKTKAVTEEFFGSIRKNLAASRKTAQVIQKSYISAPAAAAVAGDSILDVSN